MRVLVINDNSGPKYHRCILPAYLMNGIEIVINNRLVEEQAANCDILFFNRLIGNTSLQNVCDLRAKYGFKIIVDYDDYWHLDPFHVLYETYQKHNAPELMKYYMMEADGVTVTHDRLAEKVYPHNKNICILPNAIPHFGQFLATKTVSEYTRLFWAGGITHVKDIELLRNPVKRFNEFNNIQMVLGGFNPKTEQYKTMASAYTNGAKLPNNLIEALPIESYYYMYSHCDIALIPLVDTHFNSMKSNLKIIEAANISAPVVVSRVHPYLDFPEDMVNYVYSQADWYSSVKMLLNNPDFAKEQGLMLQQYCEKNFNFEDINERRKQFFYAVTGKQGTIDEVPAEVGYMAQ